MGKSVFRAHRVLVGTIALALGCSETALPAGETSDAEDESSTDPTASTTAPSTTASSDPSDPTNPSDPTDPSAGTDESTTGVDDDTEIVPLRVDAFGVPILETYYACFEFSFDLDQLGHIVGFVPVIDDVAHVHHFVLSRLDEPTMQPDGYSCFDLSGEMVYTWAPGGQQWDLPPEAGFLIGDAPGGKVTLRLQIHYNNPAADAGVSDSSGVDLLVTKTLRPHDAGTMVFGDIDGISIPPGMDAYKHISTCSGSATSQLLSETMHVFATAMHAHNIGSVLWSEVHRDGAMLYELNRDEPYLFGSQHMNKVDQVIEPGDEVQTHCIYDSSGLTETTVGGPGTANEMCWNVVNYWPRVQNPVDLCGTGN